MPEQRGDGDINDESLPSMKRRCSFNYTSCKEWLYYIYIFIDKGKIAPVCHKGVYW